MAFPISELIAQNVLTTVQTVLKANGYNYDLTVQRHSRAGDKRAHLNAIIVQGDPKPVSDPKVYNTLEWWLPFSVGVFVIPLEEDTTPIDQYCNQIAADVQKAMMVDRYRGQLALDTQILPSHTEVDAELQYDIIVVEFEVNFRTAETDGYINAK